MAGLHEADLGVPRPTDFASNHAIYDAGMRDLTLTTILRVFSAANFAMAAKEAIKPDRDKSLIFERVVSGLVSLVASSAINFDGNFMKNLGSGNIKVKPPVAIGNYDML